MPLHHSLIGCLFCWIILKTATWLSGSEHLGIKNLVGNYAVMSSTEFLLEMIKSLFRDHKGTNIVLCHIFEFLLASIFKLLIIVIGINISLFNYRVLIALLTASGLVRIHVEERFGGKPLIALFISVIAELHFVVF